ncbi:hypothetical protein O0I10_002765 [Lichtheimia ornata]|uniref:Uncharacterized protein n=1 Tax=Lichtheimia ornata TaxID=688661 RepID=A0AAD7V9L9_9FUNG|nr:uncharacterized protein O0I10_002765 [Lichtheimia ornata]KAJ8661499.1 hypothetical protein O0I10_002765 [Lichtheimia ornata]
MAYLIPKSADDDFVIQRDHCRELLVFWCFGVYKITAMIANNSMHTIGAISTSIPSSGASHYLQFGEPLETKVCYRSIMSATRSRFIPLASASFRSSGGSGYRQFL